MHDAATAPTTLSEMLARTVAKHPARPAVIDIRTTLTWREIAALAEGYAAQLHTAGVRVGDRVAVWLPNSADYLALIFAAARLRAMLVHINPRFRGREVGSVLHRATPRVLVTDLSAAADFAQALAEVPAAHKVSVERIITRGSPASRHGGIQVEKLCAAGTFADAARPDDALFILTTTGSTGEPKLVVHGHRTIVQHHLVVMQKLGFDQPDAVFLANLPFCGNWGHALAMMSVGGGASIVLPDSADIDGLIRRRRVSHMAGFADVLAWVVAAARGRRHDSMRMFAVAASPFVDNEAVFAAAEAIGLAPRVMFGSTETHGTFAFGPDGWGAAPGGTPAYPDDRFAIRDPDTDEQLPDGESGALLLAGPGMFMGYFNDPAATARAWTADGMFRTGDRAFRRGDGFVFQSRYDEAIRLGGFLVDPAEIEAVLRAQPAVGSVRVVGGDSGDGLRAVAFVVPKPGYTPQEQQLQEVCRHEIAAYKVPARIVALDALPITEGPNGKKIRLDILREMATAVLRSGSAWRGQVATWITRMNGGNVPRSTSSAAPGAYSAKPNRNVIETP
jgi:fatty-acyl-CoA synthase